MITKKLWNSFSEGTRNIILFHINDVGVSKAILAKNPYNHDFDYDAVGKALKKVLECINLQKDGTVNVVVNIKPTYAQNTTKVSNSIKKPVKETVTQRWYIDYRRPDGQEWDYAHCWVEATSENDAINQFHHDHSRDCEIVSIHR